MRMRPPLVGGAIMAICVLVYAGELLTRREVATPGGIVTRSELEQAWTLVPMLLREGEWYRAFTCIFVHASTFPFHILGNMSVVWTLGFTLEREIGSWRFAAISLVTALGSSTFVLLLSAPNVGAEGASGMILGYAGAMLPIATVQGRRALGTWLIQIAVISLLPFVSWQGHLGGFLFGLPCGLLLRNRASRFNVGIPFVVFAAAVALVIAARIGPVAVFGR